MKYLVVILLQISFISLYSMEKNSLTLEQMPHDILMNITKKVLDYRFFPVDSQYSNEKNIYNIIKFVSSKTEDFFNIVSINKFFYRMIANEYITYCHCIEIEKKLFEKKYSLLRLFDYRFEQCENKILPFAVKKKSAFIYTKGEIFFNPTQDDNFNIEISFNSVYIHIKYQNDSWLERINTIIPDLMKKFLNVLNENSTNQSYKRYAENYVTPLFHEAIYATKLAMVFTISKEKYIHPSTLIYICKFLVKDTFFRNQ